MPVMSERPAMPMPTLAETDFYADPGPPPQRAARPPDPMGALEDRVRGMVEFRDRVRKLSGRSDLTRRQDSSQASSPQAGAPGLLKVIRRYIPATRHTTNERVLGVLLAVVAVLVVAGLGWMLLLGR